MVLNERSQWLSVFDANTYAGEDAGNGTKFGSQRPGSGEYHGDALALIESSVANPAGALAAYGHLTGTCSICRRPLEDEVSLDRGIGPVCAAKVGL